MRRIVVSEFLSLDGVVEDPGGSEGSRHGAWTFKFADPEQTAYKFAEAMEHDAMLLGRTTYEGFAEAWPSRTGEFADRMNGMEKVVVSTTLRDPDWENTTVIGENVPEALAELKGQPGGDIVVYGSATLVQALMAAGLVDEYRMMVFPIVLGGGKRLFADDGGDAAVLKLVDSKPLGSGTVILTYHPA